MYSIQEFESMIHSNVVYRAQLEELERQMAPYLERHDGQAYVRQIVDDAMREVISRIGFNRVLLRTQILRTGFFVKVFAGGVHFMNVDRTYADMGIMSTENPLEWLALGISVVHALHDALTAHMAKHHPTAVYHLVSDSMVRENAMNIALKNDYVEVGLHFLCENDRDEEL